MAENVKKPVENDTEKTSTGVMLKRMAELKEMIEESKKMQEQVEKEPSSVVAKVYLQGTAHELTNTITSMLHQFKPKGTNDKPKLLAVTMLVEDLTPKK